MQKTLVEQNEKGTVLFMRINQRIPYVRYSLLDEKKTSKKNTGQRSSPKPISSGKASMKLHDIVDTRVFFIFHICRTYDRQYNYIRERSHARYIPTIDRE